MSSSPTLCKAPTCQYRVPQVAARPRVGGALQQALSVTDEMQNHHPLAWLQPTIDIYFNQSNCTVGLKCQSRSQEPLQPARQAGGIGQLSLQCLYLQRLSSSKSAHKVLLNVTEMSRGAVTPASWSFRLSHKLQLYTCTIAFHKTLAVTAACWFPCSSNSTKP